MTIRMIKALKGGLRGSAVTHELAASRLWCFDSHSDLQVVGHSACGISHSIVTRLL